VSTVRISSGRSAMAAAVCQSLQWTTSGSVSFASWATAVEKVGDGRRPRGETPEGTFGHIL